MKNHANTVLRTVGRAVAGLNDLESLMPVLHGLGTRHARSGTSCCILSHPIVQERLSPTRCTALYASLLSPFVFVRFLVSAQSSHPCYTDTA